MDGISISFAIQYSLSTRHHCFALQLLVVHVDHGFPVIHVSLCSSTLVLQEVRSGSPVLDLLIGGAVPRKLVGCVSLFVHLLVLVFVLLFLVVAVVQLLVQCFVVDAVVQVRFFDHRYPLRFNFRFQDHRLGLHVRHFRGNHGILGFVCVVLAR